MTRPDYCPVAQEPCQAMCALSDVRCIIRDRSGDNYTAPPRREPLSEDEIRRIGNETPGQQGGWNLAFACAVERAHGIGASNE